MDQSTIDLIIFLAWVTIGYLAINTMGKPKTKGKHAKK